ncbi:MAG: alpha/beta fold hydrolase [Pirellulales bacterium]
MYRISVLVLISLALPLPCGATAQANDLLGFKLDGEQWTYELEKLQFDGILLKPEGEGPFPAVLISHGLGGSAESFGLQKAREMVNWGFVCIAPNYTHNRKALGGRVSPGTGPRQRPVGGQGQHQDFGASPQNLERAATCIKILKSLPQVDSKRIYAYGHSMGGFVTIGLAAREPNLLTAAAISGSGVAPKAGFAAPPAGDAEKIRAPMILFHGADDKTVRPDQSATLQQTLDKNKVPCKRYVYEGVGHPVDQQKAVEMYRLMRDWFAEH